MTSVDFSIELTRPESALLELIELDALALTKDRKAVRNNGEFVTKLMQSLLARNGAIPAHRISYFVNPEYNIGGRGASREQTFIRNGTAASEIFQHPHFLKHLRYFVCGPDLPSAVLKAFQTNIDDCYRDITSGDVIPMAELARQLTRRHRLDPKRASEEFFKLGLEYGLSPSNAAIVRRTVRTIR